MKWYHYVSCVFAGIFLTNVIPHFVHGISGDSFPTPFATPPGKGLSSPMVNVVWGLSNMLVGTILLRIGRVSQTNRWSLLAFFAGVIYISITLSLAFVNKMHQQYNFNWPFLYAFNIHIKHLENQGPKKSSRYLWKCQNPVKLKTFLLKLTQLTFV